MTSTVSTVSIVIPAYQAADTIGLTLTSVQAQTWPAWEAVVVDDGSTDGTARLVSDWAARDPRIRLVAAAHRGASAARNEGIRHARHDLLLFLDADDEIQSTHLERLIDALSRDPDAAAAVTGWSRIAPDGSRIEGRSPGRSGDLFEVLAQSSLFAIHACLVRRRPVDEAGGFDVALRTCEDWDLWQRIARTGARFLTLPDASAWYRMRPASASIDGNQMLADGLLVQTRGHGPDPRVRVPLECHAAGLPVEGLALAQYGYACWPAGLHIGAGLDPCVLLEALNGKTAPTLDPEVVAGFLFWAIGLPRCLHPRAVGSLWPAVETLIERFLAALERQARAVGLARRTRLLLERMVIGRSDGWESLTIGRTQAIRVELTVPVPDITPPLVVERLEIDLSLEGREQGSIELPVFGGLVPGAVVADAAAAKAAWTLLGAFLHRTIYAHDLTIRAEAEGFSVWRASQCLARGRDPLPEGIARSSWFHQEVGWTVFLQELWGRPDWSSGDFYDPSRTEKTRGPRTIDGAKVSIECSAELEPLDVLGDHLWVQCRVGGAAIGWVGVPNATGRISPQQLRSAISTAGGVELCRVAVREALVGRPLDGAGSLRERLAEAAQRSARAGSARNGVVLGRHPVAPLGSAASRRAVLPGESLDAIRALVKGTGQPLLGGFAPTSLDRSVNYAPELLGPPPLETSQPQAFREAPSTSRYDRHHFELLFAAGADPWTYKSEYERLKYRQTLELIPVVARRVLELACAEGDFTVALAARVGQVVAADISEVALARTAERCAHLANVSYLRLDLAVDSLPEGFDIIVCSEVLYYIGQDRLPEVARKLAVALVPGGRLVLAHANLRVDAPDDPGFEWGLPYGALHIGRTLAAEPTLQFRRELRSPHYKIQLFVREPLGARPESLEPEVVETIASFEPIPSVAASFRSGSGGVGPIDVSPVVTDQLPILMYHRIAPTGGSQLRRYRITPAEFERQLAYLSDNGFYSVTADQWRRLAEHRRPLPGRAVLLTFDDGYRDFAAHAWPLLERYGFGALVFLVSERVGGFNEWDAALDERIALLDWDEVMVLAAQGVGFGSHSATHRRLTSLSPTEVAGELLRSRAELEQRMGRPVTTVAYPYGDRDRVVEHVAGAAGYVFGFSCRPGRAAFDAPPLALPRIEVMGSDTLEDFIVKLGRAQA